MRYRYQLNSLNAALIVLAPGIGCSARKDANRIETSGLVVIELANFIDSICISM